MYVCIILIHYNVVHPEQAIYTLSGSSAGIGFAIPVDTLKYEVDTLLRDGKVVRPALGVTYLESTMFVDRNSLLNLRYSFKHLDGCMYVGPNQ